MTTDSENADGEVGWKPLVSFAGVYKTQAEEHAYVHGHETGGIWFRMNHDPEFEQTVHAVNIPILERMGAALGVSVEIIRMAAPYDTYAEATFKRLPRKRHLAVVK